MYEIFLSFALRFAVFVTYSWYKFAPILLKFIPLHFKNSRGALVKQNWAMLLVPHTSCSKWNDELMQQPGEGKLLLILKQKTLSR